MKTKRDISYQCPAQYVPSYILEDVQVLVDLGDPVALEVWESLTKPIEGDQRPGQAFVNGLKGRYTYLSGSLHDPFYQDRRLEDAILYLLEI